MLELNGDEQSRKFLTKVMDGTRLRDAGDLHVADADVERCRCVRPAHKDSGLSSVRAAWAGPEAWSWLTYHQARGLHVGSSYTALAIRRSGFRGGPAPCWYQAKMPGAVTSYSLTRTGLCLLQIAYCRHSHDSAVTCNVSLILRQRPEVRIMTDLYTAMTRTG